MDHAGTPPPPALAEASAAALPPGPPAATVRLVYTMTTSDLFHASTEAARYSVFNAAIGTAFATTGLFTVLANGDSTGLVFLVVGLVVLTGYPVGALSAFLGSRRWDLMRAPVELTASPSGVRAVMAMVTTDAAWSTYKRVRLTTRSLIFDLGTGAITLAPRRVFTHAELAAVVGWARDAGIFDRSTPLRPFVLGAALGLAFNVLVFGMVVVAVNV